MCCCCIPLKPGAIILGIFSILAAVFGVIDFFIVLVNFSFFTFAYALLAFIYLVPATAFILMMRNPTKENKDRFALWYLAAGVAAYAVYFVFILIAGAFAAAFIGVIIGLGFTVYFYFCLKSYAEAPDVVVIEGNTPFVQ